MIQANFPTGIDKIKSESLTQWDTNQKLSFSGIETTNKVIQVQFCNRSSERAIVRMAYDVEDSYEVNVPNELLQDNFDIHAYVYLNEYEKALGVDASTRGTYFVKSGTTFVEVQLPKGYSAAHTYYQVCGRTIKEILIPVHSRKKPLDYICPETPSDEELVEELIRYCNNIGHQLDYYTTIVKNEVVNKYVRVVTMEEYETLVAEGKIEQDILYCIEDYGVYEFIEDQVNEGINKGDIVVAQANQAENANYAKRANSANSATRVNGIKFFDGNCRQLYSESEDYIDDWYQIPRKLPVYVYNGESKKILYGNDSIIIPTEKSPWQYDKLEFVFCLYDRHDEVFRTLKGYYEVNEQGTGLHTYWDAQMIATYIDVEDGVTQFHYIYAKPVSTGIEISRSVYDVNGNTLDDGEYQIAIQRILEVFETWHI